MTAGSGVWSGRSVLVTGHTGFKGGWLCRLLARSGAEIHGLALDPAEPGLFDRGGISGVLASDARVDIRDRSAVGEAVRAVDPSVAFHLAAQPLVSEGYRNPVSTWAVNVVGTANVLDALTDGVAVDVAVVVTTDKVYEIDGRTGPYREGDRLGGRDPYSASKAAAEVVVDAYQKGPGGVVGPLVATARSGNVIGGGDWSTDRLVPDCLRAFGEGRPVVLRRPDAVRPWQHVLEPVAGYVRLAEHLLGEGGRDYASGWNFGPRPVDDATVRQVAALVAESWGDGRVVVEPETGIGHETELLHLDSSRAVSELGWAPRWDLEEAVRRTVAWHRATEGGADGGVLCDEEIVAYLKVGSVHA